MKTALLFVLLSLSTLNTQAQIRRHIRTGISPHSPTGQTTLVGVNNGIKSAFGHQKNETLNSLPIRRVILYSNGIAYIERRGIVSNHAEVSLSFKQSQVDDVLKSMVVLDLGKGRIGAVSYNSSAPPSSRMAEIPFSISASTDSNNGGGLAGVLSQLQGARVVVVAADRTVTGSILTVEGRRSQIDSSKPPVTTQMLVLASDKGELTTFDLGEVRSVQLADEGSRRDLSEFAHAAASARRRDAKTIVVTSDGNGEREMVVSYTIAAPIWKTTYRVLLDGTGKPFFQGWAIVDNVSEEDWKDIDLSLVSGTPVSFIQPIQNPVYRYRPVIPLQDDLNLKPQTYEPGEVGNGTGSLTGRITDANGASVPGARVTITNKATAQSLEITADNQGIFEAPGVPPGTYTLEAYYSGFKKFSAINLKVRPGMRTKFDITFEVANISETVTVDASSGEVTSRQLADLPIQGRSTGALFALNGGIAGAAKNRESLSNLITRHDSGVEAETTAGGVGDLFQYHIDQPVSVSRDRSALIPILQTRMEGERVSIFNEQSPGHRPMSGMLLKNTSPLTLEDGSLTVIDGDAYAGEALLERLKPGEERLISFAVDLGTLVNAREEDEARQPAFLVRAVNGVVEAHYYNIRKKVYTLVNQTDQQRIVYIEHPRDDEEDWELTAGTTGADAIEDTEDSTGSVATVDDRSVTKTANHYRFRIKLAPHQKLEYPVIERNEQRESYQLTNFTRRELELFISRKYVDEKTRAKLEGIIALKDQVAAADARLLQINKEAADIAQDQQRLRENIKALTETAEARQLISRYVSKANDQETRLEQIEKDRRAVTDEHLRLQTQLDGAIRGLSLDRKL